MDTDYGKTTIVMDNFHENVHAIAPDRWVITDLEGRRFQLSELEQMDVGSRSCWNNINVRQFFFENADTKCINLQLGG